MNASYQVKKIDPKTLCKVDVPASKSELNRALFLAAMSQSDVKLLCGALCEDTRTFINCLETLGIDSESTEDGILIHGCGGKIPYPKAQLDVKSAGTAARFLPTMLAFCGGEYDFNASDQMKERPMDILPLLESVGVKIEYLEKNGCFPFKLLSNRLKSSSLTVNTDRSTQFASAILLAASTAPSFTVKLTGSRTQSSYINLTLDMMSRFGIPFERNGTDITVHAQTTPPAVYKVEPDVSGACYFCALALLCRTKILIRNFGLRSAQPDIQFLRLLENRGLILTETAEGLLADGSNVEAFDGFNEDFSDFADQALTAAALAPFASTPTQVRNVSHICLQECDRIQAAVKNLTSLGVAASSDGNDIFIRPAPIQPSLIETFGDHRVAMAFALVGLKIDGVTIDNVECAKKTFEDYFEILDEITR